MPCMVCPAGFGHQLTFVEEIISDQCGISVGKPGGKDCFSEVALGPRIFHLEMASV